MENFAEINQNNLCQFPPKIDNCFLLSTEITGVKKEEQIMSIVVCEMEEKLTGRQFKTFIRPSVFKEEKFINKEGETNKYTDDLEDDNNIYNKEKLILFLKFIGDSIIIYAHNAQLHIEAINQELNFWGLELLNKERFRCTMIIVKQIAQKINPLCNINFSSLKKCCEYLRIRVNVKDFYQAKDDCLKIAGLLIIINKIINDNPLLYNCFHNNQSKLDKN